MVPPPVLAPSTPRRNTQRASHLREVSNGSAEGVSMSRVASDTGTVQHDPVPVRLPFERKCVLWVHDEAFSKEDVVFNLDLFPDVKPREVMAITPLKVESGVRDYQDMAAARREPDTLTASMQRERSSSNPRSPGAANGSSRGYGSDGRKDSDMWNRYLFIAREMPKDMKAKHPNLEVSVAKHIADAFCLKSRSSVLLSTTDQSHNSASHVEMSFKDEYLARSDMWRLTVAELSNKTVFKGQKLLFMGTIKAQVTAVYVDGRKVQSAFFSTSSRPIFRSESARYVLFIQMSKEMWDFDSEGSGEIMFNKVVNGFLPALFKKWVSLKAKHLVSIVLFTRMEYDTGIASELVTSTHDSAYHTGVQADANKRPYKDFYRVVVSEMASGSWTTILYQLKREFKSFRRDISMHRINSVNAKESSPSTRGSVLGTRIEAEPSLAMHGNVLEAINLASQQFSHDYIDRDLMRTGISIVVITPCPGLFEVDYETLRLTTENLIGNGIGIDLVCLPKMPLHSVPLFRYRNPQYAVFQEATQHKSLRSEDSTPRQNSAVFGSSFSSLNESLSPSKASQRDRSTYTRSFATVDPPSEWSYAIPHWLDVSFWTGASQDLHLASTSKKSSKKLFKATPVQRTSDFEVRCKMYEMEMASVVENSMTEIAVTPLQHDALFPQMILGPREVPGKKQVTARDAHSDSIGREITYGSLSEFVSGPSKALIDRHSSPEDERFYRALEAFDTTKSEVSEEFVEARQRTDGKKYFKTGSEEAARKLLAEDPKVFGTSFSDDIGTLKGSDFLHNSASGISSHENKLIVDPPKTRKNSVASSTTGIPHTTPARPVKFNRQISLGKFGFGIAAPKAATAEIQIEHANAARPVSGTSNNQTPNTLRSAEAASHLLVSKSIHGLDRPPSSQSDKSKPKSDTASLERKAVREAGETESTESRPMTIRSALQSLDSTNQFKSRSVLGSVYEVTDRRREDDRIMHSIRHDDNQKVYNSKLLAGSVPELPATLSPTKALSPWLTVLNPSNPSANDSVGPSSYRRWQHVFPRPILTKTMKWKSLCSPASVPLTTEYFPTKQQLDSEYHQKPYNISQNPEEELNEVPKDREELLRELVGLRLSHGFQIVVGPGVAQAFGQKAMKIANVFDTKRIAEDGVSVFMSMGNTIHQLSCVNETGVEIMMFIRKPTAITISGSLTATAYNPAIRTTLAGDYNSRSVVLGKVKEEYNWNYVDAFIAGNVEEMSENLRFWRARFVLIPVERPTQSQRRPGEDNEEEIRLEGIKKLTQMWQRHRVLTASERRFQGPRRIKDPNPLDIVYKTEDPSIVVTAELETLPLVETGTGTGDTGPRRGLLLEHEYFRKLKLDVAGLAEAIQAPVERGGVRMQNRRWHFRLHYNCFIGSDMTTWLIENFEDIETRDEAVELGNLLMAKDEPQRYRDASTKDKDADKDMGIFVHVEKRHPFRDGQYFYQVTGEFAKQRPESRSGWFATKRRDHSVPSTPLSESMFRESPRPERSRSGSNHDEISTDSGATTPTTISGGGKKPKVDLSKVMKYDVDHRKRSYRPERIHLHYDRLHNPDNCYHIRIDWMGVTAKLIEDAIGSWASTAERYGLRLVEAPIGEACAISNLHPFRSPYTIDLALQPPDQQPRTYFDVNSFAPQVQSSPASRHYYQKAIMKKFNFVLDIEAAKNFPTNVDVTYSWGKPDFKYSQYIHRSGVVLAQITDEGGFLLLANRLYNNRNMVSKESDSLAGSKAANAITPESIKNELELFCQSVSTLEAFYKEVFERATPPSATPPTLRSPYVSSVLDSNIPTLGLPPGVLARDNSPSPMRLAGVSMPSFGRRQSAQIGNSGSTGVDHSKQDSPKGSIADSEKAS